MKMEIVSNMEIVKQIRIYVKPDDRTKAEEVLNNVKQYIQISGINRLYD